MNPTELLPFELWREIAMSDVKVWYILTRVVRDLDDKRDRETLKNIQVSVVERKGVTYTERRLNGLLHSDKGDGPSVVGSDGTFQYHWRGVLHRPEEQGPAQGDSKGYEIYYWMGKFHRLNGPAIHFNNSIYDSQYYYYGLFHRDPKEGPAHRSSMGRELYYWMGKLHRDPQDGPALIPCKFSARYYGYKPEYHVHGRRVNPPEQ